MTQSAPVKFNFETVFDDSGDVAFRAPVVKRMFTAIEMEAARKAAFAEGQRSVVAVAETEAAEALEEIARSSKKAFSALARVAHGHRTASAELAMAVGRKIADAALERFPEAPVLAAVTELAREIEAAPRLTVRVGAAVVDKVEAALNGIAQQMGSGGQVVITEAEGVPTAAFQLEWGEGRASFDPVAAADRIAAALETALAAEGLHAEPLIASDEADNG